MKDPDINTIDPMAQAFRRSEMDALRKFLVVAIQKVDADEGSLDGMSDDELAAFQRVVEAANRRKA